MRPSSLDRGGVTRAYGDTSDVLSSYEENLAIKPIRDRKMQIFVIGMHRSGTSLIARLLNLMGAYFCSRGM